MNSPSEMAATAITGPRALGTTWRIKIPNLFNPNACAASDVIAAAHREHRAARDSGHLRPAEQRQDRDHRPYRAVMHDLHQHNGGQQQRDSEEDIGDAGDQHVDPATVEAGQRTQRPADRKTSRVAPTTDGDRGAGTVYRAGVDVVALQIGAEPMRRRRCEQALIGVGVAGIG